MSDQNQKDLTSVDLSQFKQLAKKLFAVTKNEIKDIKDPKVNPSKD
jgi:hypothetical protein